MADTPTPRGNYFQHERGCPVLTAAGNPQCTCTPDAKRIAQLERDLAARESELAEWRASGEKLAQRFNEAVAERDEWKRKAEENARDAERMEFLHERCSVTFTYKRPDGTSAWIGGPSNLRAAIDAAIAAKGE